MEILRAIEMGSTDANNDFLNLIDTYSNPVYKFCRSLTYSKEDAEDLFQETFLKAFKLQDKILALDDPQNMLFSTCLYIWKSWKRKHARRKRLAPATPLDDTIANDVDIEGSFTAQEELRMVRELVDNLPDKFKIPTVLYYSMEMGVPDIALTLKIPAGTVKSRLFKARKLVEKGLAGVHYEK